MAQSKATKKFEKRHLKDVLKRRKDFAKVKQRIQLTEKRKARRAKDAAKDGSDDEAGKKSAVDDKAFENMTVDEFFQGGFDIPQPKKSKSKKGAKERSPLGKRKREQEEQEEQDESSELSDNNNVSFGDDAVRDDEESEAGSEDDDIEGHKEQLEALKTKDPEFYKFLQENDTELLDFQESKPGVDEDDEDMDDVEEIPDEEASAEAQNELTQATLDKWKASLQEKKSLRAMREVVIAFRAAAHLNEEDGKVYKYSITNSDVYHDLLVTALKEIPVVLEHHLPVTESKSGKVRFDTNSKHFRSLTPVLKSYLLAIRHLMQNLSDASTLRLTVSSTMPILPYVLSFKKAIRELIHTVVDIWADAPNTQATRVAAYLVLRKLTVIGDPGIREEVLKSTYQGLVKGSRNTTAHTLPGINLMKNSASELWGLDASVGYTTGFNFIRQLAIHLRNSIKQNANESYKAIYNWQYVHSLDFWSRVVAAHCNPAAPTSPDAPLRPLIYPTVQLTLGAMRLIPSPQYYPLRFHLIRALLRIAAATNTYVPLAPALYEVLQSPELRKPAKASTLKPLDFAVTVRAPKAYLRTRVYQDGAGEQVAELLAEAFAPWCKSVAFPELALPVVVMAKRWLKEAGRGGNAGNRNGKVNALVGGVVQKLAANARWVEERRARVEFAPGDRAGVEGFLTGVGWETTPLGAYVQGQRKAKEEREKTVEKGRKEEERRRKREKREEREAVMAVTDGFESNEED